MALLRALVVAFLPVAAQSVALRGHHAAGNHSKIAAVSVKAAVRSQAEVNAAFAKIIDPTIEQMLSRTEKADIGKAIKDGVNVLDFDSALATAPVDVKNVISAAGLHKKKKVSVKMHKQEPAEGELMPVEPVLVPPVEEEPSVDLDPDAVKKAVKTLNDMINASQIRLDAKQIECQEFEEQNQDTLSQVRTDLARLSHTLTSLAETRIASIDSMGSADRETIDVTEEQGKQLGAYTQILNSDKAQLVIHQADLAVTTFMLHLTKCEDADYSPSFMQQTAGGSSTEFEVCQDDNGNVTASFKDPRIESGRQRLTPQSQQLLDFALKRAHAVAGDKGETEALKAVGLAEGEGLEDLDDGDDDEPAQKSYLALVGKIKQTPAAGSAAVASGPSDAEKAGKRCSKAKPDCGVLHDTFANLWGEMKDLVEALQAKMHTEETAWTSMDGAFNGQLNSITAQKGQLQRLLAETMASESTEGDTQTKKQKEKATLEDVWKKTMDECHATMRDILHTEICGTITIRNEVTAQTLDVKHDDIIDCAFSDWQAQECSVPCDDMGVGGTQVINRQIIVKNTEYGAGCPELSMVKVCNVIKCPVDCKMTDWEDFSKCTKECGGGVKTRTRVVDVLPKNGGASCAATQDTQPCMTFSCDRDCTLTPWTPFSPCTKACNAGTQKQTKSVVVPVRGEGTCADEDDATRFVEQSCNNQACIGDEVCIAKIDLVIAIDASGSITSTGFEVLQEFAAKFLERLQPTAYGTDAVRVGVVLFGNGHLGDDDVVSDAHLVQPLDYDMEKARTAILGMKWQRGFTNFAQAVMRAKGMLSSSLRKDAQTISLFITDGKPSFKFQTEHAIAKLKETSTMMVAQVKSFPTEKDSILMKEYVSKPAAVNYMLIPGKKALKKAYDHYVGELLVSMCSKAESPTLTQQAENLNGYGLKAQSHVCDSPPLSTTSQNSIEDCFASISGEDAEEWTEFAYGPSFYTGSDCRTFKDCAAYREDLDWNTYERTR